MEYKVANIHLLKLKLWVRHRSLKICGTKQIHGQSFRAGAYTAADILNTLEGSGSYKDA